MPSNNPKQTYPFTESAGLLAAFQGSGFFTSSILGFFHSNGEDARLSELDGWAMTGITCGIISFILGVIAIATARYRTRTRLSFWIMMGWANSCSAIAAAGASLLGMGPWRISAALLWGWTVGAGGFIMMERLKEGKRKGQLSEYARVGE